MPSLQGLPAFAAIAVVFLHNDSELFGSDKYWTFNPYDQMFIFGHSGVEVFFVISGMIMVYVHGMDFGFDHLVRYGRKRIVRIIPLYWIVLTFLILYVLTDTQGSCNDLLSFKTEISSYFIILINIKTYSIPTTVIHVAWALYHEIIFYVVFGLCIFFRRIGGALVIAWFAASVAMLFFPAAPLMMTFFFAPVHLLFGFGIAVAWALRRFPEAPGAAPALVGALLYAAVAYTNVQHPEFFEIPHATTGIPLLGSILYGVSAALVLFGSIRLDRMSAWRIPGIAIFLGDASYSIYLIHQPAMLGGPHREKVDACGDSKPFYTFYWVVRIAANVIASIAHVVIERPLTSRLARPLVLSAERA
jgi:peptidoglycan/LPS O-acetylase OafA/YrhL